jgi:hypothetical protein
VHLAGYPAPRARPGASRPPRACSTGSSTSPAPPRNGACAG